MLRRLRTTWIFAVLMLLRNSTRVYPALYSVNLRKRHLTSVTTRTKAATTRTIDTEATTMMATEAVARRRKKQHGIEEDGVMDHPTWWNTFRQPLTVARDKC
eukprot:scaffold327_cov257-Pinguiococcus_pyrenoidosus.AAC.28